MFSRGEYSDKDTTYGVILKHSKLETEALLVMSGTVVSAYKSDVTGNYSYNNNKAKEMVTLIQKGIKKCTSKNNTPTPFPGLGAVNQHEFTLTKFNYTIMMFNGEVVEFYMDSDEKPERIELQHSDPVQFPKIDYIKLTSITSKELEVEDEDNIVTRSVSEIALDKEDVSWLQNKKYYIINDEETAEKLFTFFENYKGPIAYDTETTGLKINCFGKINSSYAKKLEEYNAQHPDDQITADRLVGIIFCVEKDVSYYFPCFNRKFKNLYEDINNPFRKKVIDNIKARYTVGNLRDLDTDMAHYVRETSPEDFRLDVILMERCRDILTKCHIVTHGGSFDWKVDWLFEIDTNIADDTILLHQLMYKFRSTTANSGEPSKLKYLAKRELGIDQWELGDFFPEFKEDSTGTIRASKSGKKKKKIDFSYMDYEGSKIYAPADGDVTFELYVMYKRDLKENHPELEYIYNVELLVEVAIGYMEFYGHRIDESKIHAAKLQTDADKIIIESKIRQLVSYNNDKETECYNKLLEINDTFNNNKDESKQDKLATQLQDAITELYQAIADNTEKPLNLASPAQVGELFFDILKIPFKGEKKSVAKNVIKGLLKEKNDDGTIKYPVVELYSKWKNADTLNTKFFDNLPNFMYPGGFIFSSYGQISTATGRMSCIEENTKITTVGGYKAIKDIKEGDLVYCYDSNRKLRIRKVAKVIDNGFKDCIEVGWRSTGNNNQGSLICTPEHKILTHSGWVSAINLNTGDRVYHLHRSSDDRPRLFGTDGISDQEQLVIKREIFNETDYNTVIHHKDEDTTNNGISNLELKSRSQHSREHGLELAELGKIKYEHLLHADRTILSDQFHPRYKHFEPDELIKMLYEANGVLTKLPIDYTTFIKKCNEYNIDYTKISNEIKGKIEVSDSDIISAFENTSGTVFAVAETLGIGRIQAENRMIKLGLIVSKSNHVKLDITDEEFIEKFIQAKGSIRGTARLCDITFWKAKKKIKELDLSYNHKITYITNAGKHRVFDLEVEDCHNFIANEICVHNCSKPNAQQYPKVITKIVIPRDGFVMCDADYSQIEYRVLTALAHNSGLAELFSNPDSDYHTLMASLMYEVDYSAVTPQMRSAAKSFNFGIPYGMGFRSLAILLTGKADARSVDEAKEKYEQYFKNQPNTRKFFDNIKEAAQVNKYTKTLFNRYRYYSFEDKDGNVNQGKKAAALRQAGNAVIQGTAADIFKIGVARNISFIRKYKLYGKMLIINMVHDEQLMEIDAQSLNVQRILAEVGKNMQFQIENFPPLFIGAGIGPAWGYAKGKMAEIHPVLLDQLTKEAENIPVYREDQSTPVNTKEVLDYFANRVLEFRRKKVADYLSNPENWHQQIHPAIGSLINLQFNYGRGDDAKAYTGPNGEKYSDQEFLELNIADFLKENNIPAEASWFKASEFEAEKEDDNEEYDDAEGDEEFNPDELEGNTDIKVFSLVDESDKTFGSSIQDLISVFGACVLEQQRVCGIDMRDVYYKEKDAWVDFLEAHACSSDETGSLQVVFLLDGNIMNNTGIYVHNIKASEIEANYKKFKHLTSKESDYSQGDVKTRSQAK